MQNHCLVLLPPLIVLVYTFLSHRIILSLILGVFTAAFILTDFSIQQTITTVILRIWEKSELSTLTSFATFKENWGLSMCLFLLILGILTVMLNHSGGAYAYGNFIRKKLKNAKATQTASLILSLFFFMDDYFSSLTVGSVMHPLTDKFKIARAKLAFLVDSMAAPLVILVPVSSWAAYIVIQFKKAGISSTSQPDTFILADPFFVYAQTIPFIFYSLILIPSVWFIVRRQISVGLMYKHESIALKTGNLFGGKTPMERKIKELDESKMDQAKMIDFLLPIITLIVSIILGLLYSGDYYLFGGSNSLFLALQSSKSQLALFNGGLITLLVSTLLFLTRKKLSFKEIAQSFYQGIQLMLPTIIVLLLAWTFSSILNDLCTGQYLANLLIGHVNIKFLPFLFFSVTALIAGTMGSAWGSMAVVIPIAIPMLISFMQLNAPAVLQSLPILIPTLGAILSGAVSGNLLAPVSDTTIMSAKSSGCYHMDHVKTQYCYSIPTLLCTGLAFLISGLLISLNTYANIIISVVVGIVANLVYLTIRNSIKK